MSASRSAIAVALSSTEATVLQVVERGRSAGSGVFEPCRRPFERPGDAIEQVDNMSGIHVGFVDRPGQERTGERAFLQVGPLGETRELRRVLLIERDIQSGGWPGHPGHDSTSRHGTCMELHRLFDEFASPGNRAPA